MKKYLEMISQTTNPILNEMEAYAKMHRVPIIEPDGIAALIHFMKIANASKILEIGTAIGYSALCIVTAIPKMQVVTIERDPQMVDMARTFIAKSQMQNQITIIEGDAFEVASSVEAHAPFDCLFIDAAKGQNQRLFELYEQLVRPGGVIFTDNVLFKGLVANTEEIESKRTKEIAEKIRLYNNWLLSHKQFDSIIVNAGDGLAVSIKKATEKMTLSQL